jgi:hypothetical protein
MGHLAEPTTSAAVAGADIYPPLPTSTPTSTPTATPLSSGDVAAGRDGRRGRHFAGTYLFGYLKEEVIQRRPLNTAARHLPPLPRLPRLPRDPHGGTHRSGYARSEQMRAGLSYDH